MAQSLPLPTVNFLRRKRQRLAVQREQDKHILWGASGFLGITLVVLLVLGGLWYWNTQQLGTLQTRQQQGETTVRRLANDEAEYLLFTYRLDLLQSIFQSQVSQQRTLEFLSELSVPGVSFQAITYEPSIRSVAFEVVAADITRLDALLELLRSTQIQDQIANLSVSQVGRNEQGAYVMEVSLQLIQAT